MHNCAKKEPIPESQLRLLTSLEPDEQREAWLKVIDTAPEGKITAELISNVVKEIKEKTTQINEKTKAVSHQKKKEPGRIGKEFMETYDLMVTEIKNARSEKWEKTSKEVVVQYIKYLLDIVKEENE